MIVSTKDAPAAIGPYSQGIVTGGLLFCSGQIPLSPDTGEIIGVDVRGQTEQIMKNIKAVLNAAGCEFSDVVKTTCFLTNMGDFAAFNEIYAKYFTSNKPARSCIAAAALPRGVLAEVEVIASVAAGTGG
ncbi:MAG: RidA family protein [Oscillospiraceae bacterium]|nr:RidA family protein [Oscillospiraceae bacterium]